MDMQIAEAAAGVAGVAFGIRGLLRYDSPAGKLLALVGLGAGIALAYGAAGNFVKNAADGVTVGDNTKAIAPAPTVARLDLTKPITPANLKQAGLA
jgi:hypothetical protein